MINHKFISFSAIQIYDLSYIYLHELCLVDTLVFSGMPVNSLGVAKNVKRYKQQHSSIVF